MATSECVKAVFTEATQPMTVAGGVLSFEQIAGVIGIRSLDDLRMKAASVSFMTPLSFDPYKTKRRAKQSTMPIEFCRSQAWEPSAMTLVVATVQMLTDPDQITRR